MAKNKKGEARLNNEENIPVSSGDISPWILNSFNRIEERLDGIGKRLNWLTVLAGIIIGIMVLIGFIAHIFIRPLWSKIVEKLLAG